MTWVFSMRSAISARENCGWNEAQIHIMHWLQRSSLKTARAWRLKEALRRVYKSAPDRATAKTLLMRWISWARHCRLAPFMKLGATIRDDLTGILWHFELGLPNGQVEAFNAQMQAVKAPGVCQGSCPRSHAASWSGISCSPG